MKTEAEQRAQAVETHQRATESWQRECAEFALQKQKRELGAECFAAALCVAICVILFFGCAHDWVQLGSGVMGAWCGLWWEMSLRDAVRVKRQLDELRRGLR
jgi:Flp pilus assembly protein TadB